MHSPVKAYRLLIVSPVPVSFKDGVYQSLDLWVEDLQANLAYINDITLISPRAEQAIESARAMPTNIKVFFQDQMTNEVDLQTLLSQHDVVSVGVGAPAWRMKHAIKVAKLSVKLQHCLIIGVTSNRAKTTTINAKNQHWLKKIKAYVIAWSIQRTTEQLIKISTGVLVVGEGVRTSMGLNHSNIYVETASWVRDEDILDDATFENKLNTAQNRLPSAIIATRLEPMKGVHLAIEALAALKKQTSKILRLSILGKGPLLNELQAAVKKHDLSKQISFDGVREYPEQFYAELAQFQLILLTNLNDEQPRLIFDAISQGLIPVCPDSAAYQHLNLPSEMMYKKGDAASLAQVWMSLCDRNTYIKMMRQLRPLAHEYTINRMHQKRFAWITSLLAGNKHSF